MDSLEKVSKLIHDAKNIAVITGAGISTASGIPDYRGSHGVYVINPDMVDVLSIQTLKNNPEIFYAYFEKMLIGITSSMPNKAHLLLAEWEACRGKNITIITQNIDSLHMRAGSSKVLELHGHARTFEFLDSSRQEMIPAREVVDKDGKVAYMQNGSIIRPSVVLFGEMLNGHDFFEAEQQIKAADLILVLGTSLMVYPFAGLVNNSDDRVPLVVINKESPPVLREKVIFLEGDLVELLTKIDEKI